MGATGLVYSMAFSAALSSLCVQYIVASRLATEYNGRHMRQVLPHPEGFSKIRVLFEVRFDDKEAGAPAAAEVYYDDLYMGPAFSN